MKRTLIYYAFQRVDSSRGSSSRASRRSRGVSTGQLQPARDSPLASSTSKPQKKSQNFPSVSEHSAEENPRRVGAEVKSDAGNQPKMSPLLRQRLGKRPKHTLLLVFPSCPPSPSLFSSPLGARAAAYFSDARDQLLRLYRARARESGGEREGGREREEVLNFIHHKKKKSISPCGSSSAVMVGLGL